MGKILLPGTNADFFNHKFLRQPTVGAGRRNGCPRRRNHFPLCIRDFHRKMIPGDQLRRGRHRHRHPAVLTPGSTLPLPQRSQGNLFGPQIFQTDGRSHNINDGIHRAHLMEMHLFRRSSVYAGLGLRQHAENGQRPLLYLRLQL